MKEKIKSYIYVARFEELIFGYIIKWILITAVVGALIGSASALLLFIGPQTVEKTTYG